VIPPDAGEGWIPVDNASCFDLSKLPAAGTSVSGACSFPASCGGAPEGTWAARSACVDGSKVFAQAYGICSALTMTSTPGTVSGQVTLANGTLTRDLTVSFSAALSLPNACTGCRCSDQEAMLASTGLVANCSPVCDNGVCTCFVSKQTHIQDSESYTTNGSTITTASGRTYSFCSKPEALTLAQTAPSSDLLASWVLGSSEISGLEICDGVDNDKNGKVDDAPRDCPPCSQQGVCAGTAIARCKGSAGWECGSVAPTYEAKETKCDGLDNDCNGKVDETAKTCISLNASCGEPDDGCGGKLSCGPCEAPETCGGGGVPLKCGCTPSCAGRCGGDDGCGGVCPNTCVLPQTCGGGGQAGVCGCTPTTCIAAGAECGSVPDLCGATLDCPACVGTKWCGGSGVANHCGCTPSSSDGPRSATMALDDASIGTRAWGSPQNILAADGTSSAISAMIENEVSHYLVAKGFGVQVPSFATIQGIKVEWLRNSLSPGDLLDNAVRLVKGGAIQTTDRSSATEWPTGATYASYGGPTDLWGTTWTPADVNAAEFGAALSVKYNSFAGNNWPYVDHARITVYFSATCP
jgi:hypothetical protein